MSGGGPDKRTLGSTAGQGNVLRAAAEEQEEHRPRDQAGGMFELGPFRAEEQ